MPYWTKAFTPGSLDETEVNKGRDTRCKVPADRLADCSYAISSIGFGDLEIDRASQPYFASAARGLRCVKAPAHRPSKCLPRGGN
jgi:hypothetical protein